MKRRWLIILAIALGGCEPNEFRPVPLGPMGNPPAQPAPAQPVKPAPAQPAPTPMAPGPTPYPIQTGPDPGNVAGKQETHAVTSRDRCYKLEQKFKQQGRKVKLARIIRNPNPGAALLYVCVFEGEDAKPGYYEDYRYNNRDEY